MMSYGKKRRPPGKLLGIYMIGYGIIRFILEFFRGDEIRGFAGGLSVSQWISMSVLAAGIKYYFISISLHAVKQNSPLPLPEILVICTPYVTIVKLTLFIALHRNYFSK
jgi:prolipoprotein diacylglyceryltransferase